MSSGSQQQFFTRNTDWGSWTGGVWNMVFVGDGEPPTGAWPGAPNTVVAKTPLIREKPFLFIDKLGNYFVMVPDLQTDTQGRSWAAGPTPGNASVDRLVLRSELRARTPQSRSTRRSDKVSTFSLRRGIYHLASPIQVSRAGTIVVGLGLTTLVPDSAAPIMTVADVDGVKVAGIIFDAGTAESATLFQVGEPGSSRDHAKDPTFAPRHHSAGWGAAAQD